MLRDSTNKYEIYISDDERHERGIPTGHLLSKLICIANWKYTYRKVRNKEIWYFIHRIVDFAQ